MASRPYQLRGKSWNPHHRWTPVIPASFVGLAVLGIIGDAGWMKTLALGPISAHMAIHLFLMNALAPFLALAVWRMYCGKQAGSGRSLIAAAVMQVILLWTAHLPAVVESTHETAIHLGSSIILFGVAFWFWLAVLGQHGAHRWRSIFALLITGKLFCLLGVLLVFSPRLLYPHADKLDVVAGSPSSGLADQHQAGLLMIVVCPLTYLVAAVIIAALWLRELSAPQHRAAESHRPVAAH